MNLKKTLAIVLAIIMVLGSASAVFAVDSILTNTDKTAVPNVAITKAVAAPAGTDVSSIGERTYKFNFERIDENSTNYGTLFPNDIETGYDASTGNDTTAKPVTKTADNLELAQVSAVVNPDTALTFTDTNQAGRYGSANAQKRTEDGVDYYMMETRNFLKDAEGNAYEFKEAGIYAFLVTEEKPATNPEVTEEVVDAYTKFVETYTYSTDTYRMLIYTDWVDKEDHSKGTYIWAMTVAKIDVNGEVIGDKDDPTQAGSENRTGDLSHFQFDNVFKRVKESTDPNEKGYRVIKRVLGTNQLADEQAMLYGDPANNKDPEKFEFTIKVTKNALYAEDTQYVGRVYDSATGNTSATAVTGSDITFTQGDGTENGHNWTAKVSLSHNQYFAFDNLPDGTVVEVKEVNYTANEVDGEPSHASELAYYGTDKVTYKTTVNGVESLKNKDTVGDGTDLSRAAEYRNNAGKGTTPAGVIMQYLPFFAIIAIAVLALVASVVVKGARRNARQ